MQRCSSATHSVWLIRKAAKASGRPWSRDCWRPERSQRPAATTRPIAFGTTSNGSKSGSFAIEPFRTPHRPPSMGPPPRGRPLPPLCRTASGLPTGLGPITAHRTGIPCGVCVAGRDGCCYTTAGSFAASSSNAGSCTATCHRSSARGTARRTAHRAVFLRLLGFRRTLRNCRKPRAAMLRCLRARPPRPATGTDPLPRLTLASPRDARAHATLGAASVVDTGL